MRAVFRFEFNVFLRNTVSLLENMLDRDFVCDVFSAIK